MIPVTPLIETDYIPDYAPTAYVVEWVEDENIFDGLEQYFIQQEEQ